MEEQPLSISGEHILENVFHLVITAVQQLSSEPELDLGQAKDHVADYLEKIVNGLRDRETNGNS